MLLNKIKGVTIVFLICIVFTVIIFHLPYYDTIAETAGEEIQYIIDPGHGMPDGGAVGSDGTTEQELNLAIAQKVAKQMKKQKANVVMTRNNENSIYTDGETIHAKKVSDIRNRIELAGKYKRIPLISIHLNTFPDSSVRGTQVFYKEGDETSRLLAQALQNAFNNNLQAENPKVIKPISKNIYLFSHIENPAILIECGFLSNKEELINLKNEKYQNKIAKIIVQTLMSQG